MKITKLALSVGTGALLAASAAQAALVMVDSSDARLIVGAARPARPAAPAGSAPLVLVVNLADWHKTTPGGTPLAPAPAPTRAQGPHPAAAAVHRDAPVSSLDTPATGTADITGTLPGDGAMDNALLSAFSLSGVEATVNPLSGNASAAANPAPALSGPPGLVVVKVPLESLADAPTPFSTPADTIPITGTGAAPALFTYYRLGPNLAAEMYRPVLLLPAEATPSSLGGPVANKVVFAGAGFASAPTSTPTSLGLLGLGAVGLLARRRRTV